MEINTEFYEGPLDLLLSFVEKENESIYSVNICTIIDQYLVAINGKDLSLDDMSSFALMAARLLEIKSRMLLPPEEDEDPAEELRDELAEHQLFKEASKQLLGMYEQHSGSVVRTSTVEKIVSDKRPKRSLAQEVLKDLTLNDLSLVWISPKKSSTMRKSLIGLLRILPRLENAGFVMSLMQPNQTKEGLLLFYLFCP